MKIRKLILLGILTISVSCGLEDLGPSDCSVSFWETLHNLENVYQDDMGRPDSDGNHQSLEACLNKRGYTEEYLLALEGQKIGLNYPDGNYCTVDEISSLNYELDERIGDLEEDLEVQWSTCEEIYGGD